VNPWRRNRSRKTLILLDEDEVREVLKLAATKDRQAILLFITTVISKKVEAALRSRCQ
jgi:hypothetical protein